MKTKLQPFTFQKSIHRAIFLALWLGLFSTTFAQSNTAKHEALQNFSHHNRRGVLIENKRQLTNDKGEAVPQVLFSAEVKGLNFYITQSGITYVMSKVEKNDAKEKPYIQKAIRLDVDFLNATISSKNVEYLNRNSTATFNFFNANHPEGIYGVPSFTAIKIKNIYPGVDWQIMVSDTGLKYNFELAAGVNPNIIQLKYTGADELQTTDNGCLVMKTKVGNLTENTPISFQGKGKVITHFNLAANHTVGFICDNLNEKEKLIIDPTMVWATIFGGSASDNLDAVAVDKNNNFYVTGFSQSSNFPSANAGGYYDVSIGGSNDIVIAKFNANMGLVWATYYGGTGGANFTETGTAIKTDFNGDMYVAGYTNSSNFPTQSGGGNYYSTSLNGSGTGVLRDAFLLKFNSSSTRIFATLFGGNADDGAYDLAIDPTGNVYMTGLSASSNFPIQAGTGYNDSSPNGLQDGFISKFNSSGALQWSTYFGGNGDDAAYSVSLDGSGNIFIAGSAASASGFPFQNNGTYFNNTPASGDGFVAKFSASQTLQWSTLYGGTAYDAAFSTTVDKLGNLYVGGTTLSTDLPTYATSNYYKDDTLNHGGTTKPDVFLLKFTNSGTRLWSTFLGGSDSDAVFPIFTTITGGQVIVPINDALVTDNCNSVYFSWQTNSDSMKATNPGCNTYSDNNLTFLQDAFLTKFTKHGVLDWATYFGSLKSESGLAMALDNKSNIMAAGFTCSLTGFDFKQYLPVSYYNTTIGGAADGFLLRFNQPIFNADVSYTKCQPGCTGAAQAIINSSCNLASYSYLWSTGATTSSVNNLCTGSCQVIVTDTAISCTSDTVNFVISSGIHIAPTYSANSCQFNCNGMASVIVPGNPAGVTFTWHTPDSLITGVSAISHVCNGWDTLIVNIPGCAADTVTFFIPIPPVLTVTLNAFDAGNLMPCPMKCTGKVELILNGGQNPGHVTWNNGVKGTTLDHMCPGATYTALVTDSICYTTVYTVTMPPLLPEFGTASATQIGCAATTGSVSAGITNGHAPMSYHWNTGAITPSVPNLPLGNYSCIVSDSCITDTVYCSITLAPLPLPLHDTITLDTSIYVCDTTCKASVTLLVQYGTPPYTIFWSNGVVGATTLNNLCPDTLSVLIADACGDTLRDTIIVYRKIKDDFHVNAGASTLCCVGTCQGVATCTGVGGATPYTYLWFNGATTNTVSGLCPDSSYWVVGWDACLKKDSFHFIFPRPQPLTLPMGSLPSCEGLCNGTAFANPGGGLSPYTIVWNTGLTVNTTLLNACYDSTYTCMFLDACGNGDTASVIIPQSPPPNGFITSTQQLCYANCNATATLNFNGLYPPYYFYWSSGSYAQTANNLCTDSTYYCILSSIGCSSDTFYVHIPTYVHVQANIASFHASCSGLCNGTASAFFSNGQSPYSYYWSNGTTGSTGTNLCPGSNYCIITDACGFSDTAYVIIPVYGLPTASVSAGTISCANACTGIAQAFGAGGLPPYSYFWSTGASTAQANNLCVGINTCIVTDACLHNDTVSVTITTYQALQASLVNSSVSCVNSCTGSASVLAVGGNPPYSYLWNNGSTSANASNLCIGSDTCIVTDACFNHDTVICIISTITPITLSSFTQSNSNCNKPCNGSATITILNGLPPYTYLWSNGASTPTVSGLCAGIYSVLVTNPSCTSDSINSTANIIANITLSHTAVTDATCYDTCNGTATIIATGSNPPFSYNWSNGLNTASSSSLCDGTYIITVDDNNGNVCHDTVTINQPPQIILDTLFQNNHCIYADGSVSFTAAGGTPPYTYLWNTGSTGTSLTNLPKGIYTVVVTDAHLCHITQTFNLNSLYPHLVINRDTLVGVGQPVEVFAYGANAYFWTPPFDLTCDTCSNPMWIGKENRTYCVIGRDSWGCEDTACFTITTFDDCGVITMPNAFSPNGDGKNDFFRPVGRCIEKAHWHVYDRWGNHVFEGFDIKHGWDGTYKGEPLPGDVYVWYLEATDFYGIKVIDKGDVTLMR